MSMILLDPHSILGSECDGPIFQMGKQGLQRWPRVEFQATEPWTPHLPARAGLAGGAGRAGEKPQVSPATTCGVPALAVEGLGVMEHLCAYNLKGLGSLGSRSWVVLSEQESGSDPGAVV